MSKRSATSLFIMLVMTCLPATFAATDQKPDAETKLKEKEKNNMILLNVATKGRVVELLANELARTEIIRALLVEYAKECVENVTKLEKYCLNCMIQRCQDRMNECGYKDTNISQVITHKPSPIKGIQFLSQAPNAVDQKMQNFANRARADILQDVPEALRKESEVILHAEVDQSMKDLNDNINTDKALQAINVHVQQVTDSTNNVTVTGDTVGTIIIENEDRNTNVVDLLTKKLKQARPIIMSIGENGARLMEQMPGVIKDVNDKVILFKDKISGIFNKVLTTFQRVMDEPETQVRNDNFQQTDGSNPGPFPQAAQFNQNMNQMSQNINRMSQNVNAMSPSLNELAQVNQLAQISGVNSNPFPANIMMQNPMQGQIQRSLFNVQAFPVQLSNLRNIPPGQFEQISWMQNQQFPNQIPPNTNFLKTIANQIQDQIQDIKMQLQGQPLVDQGQNTLQNHPFPPQSMNTIIQNQKSNQLAQSLPANRIVPQTKVMMVLQAQITPNQSQEQMLQPNWRRQRRHVDADCDKLKGNPEVLCRMYETDCYNCTLEKRLRFEVCGDGVEKARDEIRRMDNSVTDYIKAYDDHIAGGPLVVKIELNNTNRLVKMNTFSDAFVTAKIGPSIIRYKTKMILNMDDLRSAGSQLGDELWEKLWASEVFAEAPKIQIASKNVNVMGQAHTVEFHSGHAHQQSSGSCTRTWLSWNTAMFSLSALFLIAL